MSPLVLLIRRGWRSEGNRLKFMGHALNGAYARIMDRLRLRRIITTADEAQRGGGQAPTTPPDILLPFVLVFFSGSDGLRGMKHE